MNIIGNVVLAGLNALSRFVEGVETPAPAPASPRALGVRYRCADGHSVCLSHPRQGYPARIHCPLCAGVAEVCATVEEVSIPAGHDIGAVLWVGFPVGGGEVFLRVDEMAGCPAGLRALGAELSAPVLVGPLDLMDLDPTGRRPAYLLDVGPAGLMRGGARDESGVQWSWDVAVPMELWRVVFMSRGPVLWWMRVSKLEAWYQFHRWCEPR